MTLNGYPVKGQKPKPPTNICLEEGHKMIISACGYPTRILVGTYPTDGSEMYIETQNGTIISIDLDGAIRINIPKRVPTK